MPCLKRTRQFLVLHHTACSYSSFGPITISLQPVLENVVSECDLALSIRKPNQQTSSATVALYGQDRPLSKTAMAHRGPENEIRRIHDGLRAPRSNRAVVVQQVREPFLG